MPRYIFVIRASDGDAPERAAELNDDAAALAYACEIVRELTQGLAHADRGSLVKVRDETRQWCFQFPSLRRAPNGYPSIKLDRRCVVQNEQAPINLLASLDAARVSSKT